MRCQSQPAAAMVARPMAPVATLDTSGRVGCGLTSWSYVSASSDFAGRGRLRLSGTGTHRETKANDSEAQSGHVSASCTSSQSRQTRATRRFMIASVPGVRCQVAAERFYVFSKWSRRLDLNQRPADYESISSDFSCHPLKLAERQ